MLFKLALVDQLPEFSNHLIRRRWVWLMRITGPSGSARPSMSQ